MKQLTLFGLFLCFTALAAPAQDKVVKTEKLVVYAPFKIFFERHPELKEIRFSKEWPTDSLELDMVEKDTAAMQAFNHFDLAEESDRYFYRKRFAPFPFPAKLYAKWLDKKADVASIGGVVRNDSVFLTIRQTYFKQNEDEKIFIKIESKWGHQKGLHVLAQELDAKMAGLDVPPGDSTVVLKYLLEKTGNLSFQKIEKGTVESAYTKILVACVQDSGPWIPFETGGRKVRRYIQLFIRLRPDKTYTVAID